jgi:hypothetical protein
MFASGISFAADAFTVMGGVQALVDLWNGSDEADRQTMMTTLHDHDGAIEDQRGYNVLVEPGYTQTYQLSSGPQRPGDKALVCSTNADRTQGYCRVIE